MMSHTVNIEHFSRNEETRNLVTEASDIGLKPGQWPEQIVVQSDKGEASWQRSNSISFAGEFMGYNYVNGSTWTLRIYND